MTIADAYIKYEEMKEWYDSKVGAVTNKIREIDQKISELTAKLANAVVGSKIYNETKRKIDNFIKKIKALLESVMKFISEFEQKIKDWITKKVKQIQQEIVEKQKRRAEMKAAAALGVSVELPSTEKEDEAEEVEDIESEEELCELSEEDYLDALEALDNYLMTTQYSNVDSLEAIDVENNSTNMFDTKVKSGSRNTKMDSTTEKSIEELFATYVDSSSSSTSSSNNSKTYTDNEKKALIKLFGKLPGGAYATKFISLFGPRNIAESASNFHHGIDIGYGKGTPIYAPADGVIVTANNTPTATGGRTVLIALSDKQTVLGFCHLNTIPKNIKNSTVVKAGTIIGFSGNSGQGKNNATYGYHIHMSYRNGKDSQQIDPRIYLNLLGSTL